MILLLIGIVGLLGATLLFPLLGMVWSAGARYFGSEARSNRPHQPPRSLAILIPVHNEEVLLGRTLASVRDAVEHLQAISPDLRVRTIVGLNGCTDASRYIAEEFRVEVIEDREPIGKWAMVERLVDAVANEATEATVLADAGVEWPTDFLTQCFQRWADDIVGIAPTYRHLNAGMAERMSWWSERVLKSLENFSGGPVSVHGATVIYRTSVLRRALQKLAGQRWLNDDVVIPLIIRAMTPGQKLLYLAEVQACDRGLAAESVVVAPKSELNRRHRMMVGNLQWVATLIPFAMLHHPLVGLLSLRRVFRILWAYWILFIGLGIVLWALPISGDIRDTLESLALVSGGAIVGAFLWFVMRSKRAPSVALAAAVASFQAPLVMFRSRFSSAVRWK